MGELNDDNGLWFSVRGTSRRLIPVYADYAEYQASISRASAIFAEGRTISGLGKTDIDNIAFVALLSAFEGKPHEAEQMIIADEERQLGLQ